MKKKTNETSKAKSQATALRDRITNIILNGKGIRRRVEAAAAEPVKFTADDGIKYDPRWQDDIIGPRKKSRKVKTKTTPKYPNIKVPVDGDRSAFCLISRILQEMRRAGVSKEERDAFQAEAFAPLYDLTITTAQRWVTVVP